MLGRWLLRNDLKKQERWHHRSILGSDRRNRVIREKGESCLREALRWLEVVDG